MLLRIDLASVWPKVTLAVILYVSPAASADGTKHAAQSSAASNMMIHLCFFTLFFPFRIKYNKEEIHNPPLIYYSKFTLLSTDKYGI